MSANQGLPSDLMFRLAAEVRGATRRMSREQVLDLADMLHDEIRSRREVRSWRPARGRAASGRC
ncbi:hypothetical protein LJR164_001400 [Phenylobacterium sp. LjRoot164]|uniref:hypothetical protein n=1 Tax=unclassified Phenylobacterium TaxID=2640670 RepID=UPI003ECE4BEC